MSEANEALIHKFYTAFTQRDAETMASCYHEQVHFSDPAFDLKGKDAGDMWRMLFSRADDLLVEYKDVRVVGDKVHAHWDATYTFSTTGRKVVNRVDAVFTFEDGLIKRHEDSFDFWTWSKQALGTPGLLLGWSSFLKNKVQGEAKKNLRGYQKSQA